MSHAAFVARKKRMRERRAALLLEQAKEILHAAHMTRGEKPLVCYFCHDETSWTWAELSEHVKNSCSLAPLPRGGGFEEQAAEILAANMIYPTQRSKADGRKPTSTIGG